MIKLDNDFPTFDQDVLPQGYAWWYLDALSNDEKYGLTIIAFIGSVFSPYYAWAGRHAPHNHCSINVALYGGKKTRWSMTERGRKDLIQTADTLKIGPSTLEWRDASLILTLRETAAPIPKPISGTIRLTPTALTQKTYFIDDQKAHRWRPIAPMARIKVSFERPALSWSGTAYLDFNSGYTPLETSFQRWDWMRAHMDDKTIIIYDKTLRTKEQSALALQFDPHGNVEYFPPPSVTSLAKTPWGIERRIPSEDKNFSVKKTVEDSPFYARSFITTTLLSQTTTAVHESLDLDRFATQWVKMLLPFRMPRRIV